MRLTRIAKANKTYLPMRIFRIAMRIKKNIRMANTNNTTLIKTTYHLFIRGPVQKARVDTTNKAAKLKKKTGKVRAPTKVIKFTRRK